MGNKTDGVDIFRVSMENRLLKRTATHVRVISIIVLYFDSSARVLFKAHSRSDQTRDKTSETILRRISNPLLMDARE